MRFIVPTACLAVWAVSLASAWGQNAVQLPTISHFGVSTTVLAPDRGSAPLGGVSRSALGVNQFGVPLLPGRPFTNRAIGSSTSAATVRATVTVHDFDAMESQILGGAAASSLPPPLPRLPEKMLAVQPGGVGMSWKLDLPNPAAPAELPATGTPDARQEAADLFSKAQRAESQGKANVAKIYYQMVVRRAVDPLSGQALDRLSAIEARNRIDLAEQSIPQGRPNRLPGD